eukprot:TRINITY_DN14793_c0_g1_i1.p1 TRINITY_DN14793_c0_g1~~TRINITY_DN14793_c0_g1_i1.p1  ORF type:complete len:1141 (-),score=267.27 TRINITY_DN14793_c0_g1_i1:23-3340(-)
MFANSMEQCGSQFLEWLEFMGKKVRLETLTGYRGDMGTTGETYYEKWMHLEVVYHVSPILTAEGHRRLVGNDIAVIVFLDETIKNFDPSCMLQLGTVPQNFVVVQPIGSEYKVGFFSAINIKTFLPAPPSFLLDKKQMKDMILTKVHNGLVMANFCVPMNRLWYVPRVETLHDIIAKFPETKRDKKIRERMERKATDDPKARHKKDAEESIFFADDKFTNTDPGNFIARNARILLTCASMTIDDETKLKSSLLIYGFESSKVHIITSTDVQGFICADDEKLFISLSSKKVMKKIGNTKQTLQLPNTKSFVGTVRKSYARAIISIWGDLFSKFKILHNKQKVWLSGHSNGAAIIMLVAHLLALNFPDNEVSGVYTFGGPKIGDETWSAEYDKLLRQRTWRVVHANDLIPTLPPTPYLKYFHAGQQVVITQEGKSESEYKVKLPNPNSHTISSYAHILTQFIQSHATNFAPTVSFVDVTENISISEKRSTTEEDQANLANQIIRPVPHAKPRRHRASVFFLSQTTNDLVCWEHYNADDNTWEACADIVQKELEIAWKDQKTEYTMKHHLSTHLSISFNGNGEIYQKNNKTQVTTPLRRSIYQIPSMAAPPIIEYPDSDVEVDHKIVKKPNPLMHSSPGTLTPKQSPDGQTLKKRSSAFTVKNPLPPFAKRKSSSANFDTSESQKDEPPLNVSGEAIERDPSIAVPQMPKIENEPSPTPEERKEVTFSEAPLLIPSTETTTTTTVQSEPELVTEKSNPLISVEVPIDEQKTEETTTESRFKGRNLNIQKRAIPRSIRQGSSTKLASPNRKAVRTDSCPVSVEDHSDHHESINSEEDPHTLTVLRMAHRAPSHPVKNSEHTQPFSSPIQNRAKPRQHAHAVSADTPTLALNPISDLLKDLTNPPPSALYTSPVPISTPSLPMNTLASYYPHSGPGVAVPQQAQAPPVLAQSTPLSGLFPTANPNHHIEEWTPSNDLKSTIATLRAQLFHILTTFRNLKEHNFDPDSNGYDPNDEYVLSMSKSVTVMIKNIRNIKAFFGNLDQGGTNGNINNLVTTLGKFLIAIKQFLSEYQQSRQSGVMAKSIMDSLFKEITSEVKVIVALAETLKNEV